MKYTMLLTDSTDCKVTFGKNKKLNKSATELEPYYLRPF